MLTVPEVIWAAEPDERLDAHIAAYRGHRRVHCARNPAAYERETDAKTAVLACAGCPILRACREQALRQEAGAGASYGIRGGMTPAARQTLIVKRPAAGARTILPPTLSRTEVIAYLASKGYEIAANTWSSKASRGVAPKPVYSGLGKKGAHWDVREVRAFDPGQLKANQYT